MNKKLIPLLIFLFFCAGQLLAEDAKYFSAFSYRQKAFWGSDFSMSPELRFENGAKELYFYHFRIGFLFHPRNWLDVGLYYRFVQEREAGNWQPENRYEFVFTPKIVIPFVERLTRAGMTGEGEGVGRQFVRRIGAGVLRVWEIVAMNEFEFREVDYQDLSKVHVVYRVRPKMSWEYGFGTLYAGDEIFYSLRDDEIFLNWAMIGIVRPLNGLSLDMYYIYESERRQPKTDIWDNAHVLGTRIIWYRD